VRYPIKKLSINFQSRLDKNNSNLLHSDWYRDRLG